MSSEPINPIADTIGKSVGEISVAILVLVHALKKQPGFDIESFDNQIKKLLEGPEIEDGSITESILKAALVSKN